MMPVDTSIYQNLLRAPKSVADYDAEWQDQQTNALTLQTARNALAMQSQEMEAAQRSAQEAGAFNNALRGIDLNTPEGQRAAMQANPTRALPLLTSNAKLQDQYAETRGRDATAMKTLADAVSKKLDMHKGQLAFVQNAPQAAAWMRSAWDDPDLGPILQRLGPIEQLVQSIPQDPQGLQNWVLQASEGAAKLRERVNAEAAQGETVRRNKATEGIQIRGQNMTDQRQRDALAQSDRQFQTRRADDAAKIAAPPKAAAAETARVADAKDVLEILKQAEPLIERSTGSYAGVAVDEAARTFGKSTPGAEAAAELKALEGALISKMPKMSGPQSDKDVLLYKQMAGQIGDPTIPKATKKAAMGTIRTLNERYAGVKGSQAPTGQVKFLGFE